MSDLWSNVLSELKKKISAPSYETWLKDTTAEIEGEVITIKSNNVFSSDWLESRYKDLIFETVREIARETYDLEFVPREGKVVYHNLTQKEYIDLHKKVETLEKRIEKLESPYKKKRDVFGEPKLPYDELAGELKSLYGFMMAGFDNDELAQQVAEEKLEILIELITDKKFPEDE
ncbi:DnaA N-terminal domain-containing protein [Aquibacillus albus]|uniref:Chromosomal replication initiation ATPase DnaA n=1 Tax=Aquibacillus albus TaxID=1168171 RepID=A0ABS2N4I2_9BACI|nr:DnaA N-terminal domain-containing protein [Aquibacillus albus]MBM7573050.1 chromosomal replication initiation ATPase DnaA [Aquibacillus albus]